MRLQAGRVCGGQSRDPRWCLFLSPRYPAGPVRHVSYSGCHAWAIPTTCGDLAAACALLELLIGSHASNSTQPAARCARISMRCDSRADQRPRSPTTGHHQVDDRRIDDHLPATAEHPGARRRRMGDDQCSASRQVAARCSSPIPRREVPRRATSIAHMSPCSAAPSASAALDRALS